ncbi:hypothetical protein D5038_20855, partial [Verminephrobacter aporrectodeae subsp. tuberculatae]|uniref:hypothetical protein n=1 Tax=Verminephrobacter aporrectodeae TaxID=1110389 RepID=UPI0022374E5D
MGYPNNKELINSSDGLPSITAAVVNNTGRIYGDSIAITGASNNSTGAGGGAAIASLFSNKLLALVLSCAVAVGGATASVPDVGASTSPARNVPPAGAVTDATRGGTLGDATASANRSVAVTDASVRGTGVNNQDGVIAANGQATVSAGSGVLNNAGGQTYSTQGALSLSGGSI